MHVSVTEQGRMSKKCHCQWLIDLNLLYHWMWLYNVTVKWSIQWPTGHDKGWHEILAKIWEIFPDD